MAIPPIRGRSRVYEEDAVNVQRQIDRAIARAFKNQQAATFKGQLSSAGLGVNGATGNVTVPNQPRPFSLTVPNNGTASLPVFNPDEDYGYLFLQVGWKRGATRGIAYMDVHHNGTTGTLRHLIGTNPGWNTAGFVVSVTGDDLTITFAANNAGSNIEMYVSVNEWQPLIV